MHKVVNLLGELLCLNNTKLLFNSPNIHIARTAVMVEKGKLDSSFISAIAFRGTKIIKAILVIKGTCKVSE